MSETTDARGALQRLTHDEPYVGWYIDRNKVLLALEALDRANQRIEALGKANEELALERDDYRDAVSVAKRTYDEALAEARMLREGLERVKSACEGWRRTAGGDVSDFLWLLSRVSDIEKEAEQALASTSLAAAEAERVRKLERVAGAAKDYLGRMSRAVPDYAGWEKLMTALDAALADLEGAKADGQTD